MLKLLILICMFYWVDSMPCPPPNPPELILGYPACKSGYTEFFECDFRPNIVVKYCYNNHGNTPDKTTRKVITSTQRPTTPQPTTTPTPEPTTTPTPEPTTTPTPEPTTTPTPEPTTTPTPEPTTTPTPEPTTTPTTTEVTTTTTVPSTTPKAETCGLYPVGGKMWNADIVTSCQPWLVSIKIRNSLTCNAVLVSENTLLTTTDATCVKKSILARFDIIPMIGETKIGVILKDSVKPLDGTGMTVIKLKDKVDTSMNCVNPVCLPTSRDDYDENDCKVGAYGANSKNSEDSHLYLGSNIKLLPESTCLARKPTPQPGSSGVLPSTLCSYPWVQGSSQFEKGGMLICKSKSSPSNWILAGITQDTKNGTLNADEPVYYWDVGTIPPFLWPI